MNNCKCGRPVFIKKTGECRSCYNARYFREHYTPRAARPLAGSTEETSAPCSYDAAHSRVRRVRGLPSEHRCAECGDAASEWAYRNESPREQQGWSATRKGGARRQWSRWSPFVWDYDPLCAPCHRERDAEILPSTAGSKRFLKNP